jgi:hypothetical protein
MSQANDHPTTSRRSLLALLGASATTGSIAAATATAAPGAVIASPRLLDLKRQLDAALVEFEAINRRYLAANEIFERMMEGYDPLKAREEWKNARERAEAITHYGEINEEW